jgi:squalene monooxygenase
MMQLAVEKTNPIASYENEHTDSSIYDVCVIGAGVAGAAMAAYLGKAGKRVVVIEKDFSEQDRIVGELLQPGGVIKLQELGLADCLENIDAATVTGYAIFKKDKQIQISYPDHYTGRGFRNGKFVQNLRKKLAEFKNITRIEGMVTELKKNELGKIVGVNYDDRQTGISYSIHADLTIVCDGFFSIFRKELSQNQSSVSGFFLGLILKNTELPHAGHGHVFITDHSPFLAYPVSSSEIRMLIDFPGTMPPKKSPELRKELKVKVLPFLPEGMHASFLEAIDEGDFKVMPNHYMPGKPYFGAGAVLLGDALTMRHPLTGGGMTASFTDVLALGKLIIQHDIKDSVESQRTIWGFYRPKRRDNSTINILADALYRVFRDKKLADACFDYLARGGKFAEEPVSILSGISRDKNLLITHFFAVARYGAGNIRKNGGSLGDAYQMIRSAFQIVYPLILNEKPRLSEKIVMKLGSIFFPPQK